MIKIILLLTTFLLIFPVSGHDLVHRNEFRQIYFKKDGSYDEEKCTEMEVLTDEGRDEIKVITFPFFSSVEEIKEIEVTIINNEKIEVLTKDNFKLITRSLSAGLSDEKSYKAILPNINIGTKVKIDLKRRFFNNPHGNKRKLTLYYGSKFPEENSRLEIKSDLPLTFYVNSLNDSLKVVESKPKELIVQQVKKIFPPKYKERHVAFNPLQRVFVSVSTATSFSEYYSRVIEENEIVQEQFSAVDVLGEEGLELLKQKLGDREELINYLSKVLHEKFVYTGNYLSAEDHFWIKDISSQIKKGSGDCKFFSHLALKVLRTLGFEAELVLGELSTDPTIMQDTFPFPSDFNHMFLRVIVSGYPIYIDPTNYKSSKPNFISTDLMFRKVFPLKKGGTLVNIDEPLKKVYELEKNYYFVKTDELFFNTEEFVLRGPSKTVFDWGFSRSKDKAKFLGDFLNTDKKVIHNKEANETITSFKNDSFPLDDFVVRKPYSLAVIDEILKDQKREFDLNIPDKVATKYSFITPNGMSVLGSKGNCRIDNEYFEYSSELIKTENGSNRYTQTYYPKAGFIPKDEVNRLSQELQGREFCFPWKKGLVIYPGANPLQSDINAE